MPGSTAEEILQNVRIICSTPKGTVPLDRDFGVDFSLIDNPINLARPKLIAEFAVAISKYEPRANLLSVDFNDTAADIAGGDIFCKLTLDLEGAE